jgi:hypothetical protein
MGYLQKVFALFHDFPLKFYEGSQLVGHSMGTDIVVEQQDAPWQSPLLLEWIVRFSPL